MKRIAVFCGANYPQGKENFYSELAYETGKLLAENGFTVITGGGPALMNDCLRGAYEAGGETIGIALEISGRKQSTYAKERLTFKRLVPRQEKLIEMSDAFIALPGGIGTIHEIFDVLALKRAHEIPKDKFLILVGSYFKPISVLLHEVIREGFIDRSFLECLTFVANPKEAVRILKDRL